MVTAERHAGVIKYNKKKIMFFPDISANLRKRRQVFDLVKKQLAALTCPNLHYGVIHPATLLITMKENGTNLMTYRKQKSLSRG